MKRSQLKEIIKKKASKTEFAIITNLENGLSEMKGKELVEFCKMHGVDLFHNFSESFTNLTPNKMQLKFNLFRMKLSYKY